MVLPMFLAIVFAVFLFGWTQHNYSSLRFGLQQAARALLLNQSLNESALQTIVRGKMQGTAASNATVTLSVDTVSGVKQATLTGVYAAQLQVPFVATFPVRLTDTVIQPLP